MKKTFMIISMALTIVSNAQISSNGVIGWYPFYENTNDASGNANNGIPNGGANLTTDRFGNSNYAYEFDGVPLSYISCGSDSIYDIKGGGFSVSVWIKPDTNIGSFALEAIVSKVSKSTINIHGSYGLWITNLMPQFVVTNLDGIPTWYTSIVDSNQIANLEWTHLVAVADSVNQKMKIYVNGQFTAQTNWSTQLHDGPTQNLLIGSNYKSNFGSQYMYNFGGSIDDVRIYKGLALDSAEIQELFNEQKCFETIYDTITTYSNVEDTLTIDAVLTGVSVPNNINEIKVYPNPAKTHITIDNGNFNSMNGYTITIENSVGQNVFSSSVNQQQFYIDLSTWTGTGLYFLHIIDNTSNVTEIKKLIIE